MHGLHAAVGHCMVHHRVMHALHESKCLYNTEGKGLRDSRVRVQDSGLLLRVLQGAYYYLILVVAVDRGPVHIIRTFLVLPSTNRVQIRVRVSVRFRVGVSVGVRASSAAWPFYPPGVEIPVKKFPVDVGRVGAGVLDLLLIHCGINIIVSV